MWGKTIGPPTEAPHSLRTRGGATKFAGFERDLAMPIALLRAVSNRDPCTEFVPDLVVMMAVAGSAYMALVLVVSTRTSCTESGSGNWFCVELSTPPKFRLANDTPSATYSRASGIS